MGKGIVLSPVRFLGEGDVAIGNCDMAGIGSYLKKHTEVLVKDVGIEPACVLTGKSKATLGRYYSDNVEHADRFMPIDAVALLEEAASYPHVTAALAELKGIGLEFDDRRPNSDRKGGVNSDVIALSQRFAMLMGEYQQSMEDGRITVNEAKRLLKETTGLQQILIDMKLNLNKKVADTFPALQAAALPPIDVDGLKSRDDPGHKPRILLLYGSLRDASYSRKAALESARILRLLGCETKMFDPSGLPLPDGADPDHPKVIELRDLAVWSEGMVWSSPERHGAMTAVMKAQIDWLPLSLQGGIRPTQGKTLAVMQVSGGSQSFNAVNQMRILGRWMRMVTIPNQSSIPKAWLEFDGDGRLPEGPFYARIVDVMEELVKFTWLVRGRSDYLVDRYSERVETADDVHTRVSKK